MNIHDKAHELASALSASPEVIKFREASKRIGENETSKKMIEDFRKLQFEAYSEQMKDGKMSDETEGRIRNLGMAISMNAEVAAYLQAEAQFAVIWQDIMKILNDAIDVNLGIENL